VRGFTRYLNMLDPLNEVPPKDFLPAHRSRITPYLYSDAEIAGVLAAASALMSALRAATLVGLLVVTGLRIEEAIRLDRTDVDLEEGSIIVRRAKFGNRRTHRRGQRRQSAGRRRLCQKSGRRAHSCVSNSANSALT
jgi:integrase/recombinase XerD